MEGSGSSHSRRTSSHCIADSSARRNSDIDMLADRRHTNFDTLLPVKDALSSLTVEADVLVGIRTTEIVVIEGDSVDVLRGGHSVHRVLCQNHREQGEQ